MKMKRPPEALVAWFPKILPKSPEVEPRRMFGCPCAFVRGHMFAGVFEDRVFLRLGDAERARFLQLPDAEPWRPMGRPMGGYVVAPPDMVEEAQEIAPWMSAAFAYAASLPKKAPRKAPKKAPKKEAPKRKTPTAKAPKRARKKKTARSAAR